MADTGREGRFSELIRRAINDGPQTVTHRGLANICFADGHVKSLKQNAVTDAHFTRD